MNPSFVESTAAKYASLINQTINLLLSRSIKCKKIE